MKTMAGAVAIAGLLLLGGCATVPTGPSVMALPGTGKNFEDFRRDDAQCRQYAQEQIGGTTAQQAANDSAVRSAVVGTAIGAVAGAAIGGRDSAGAGAAAGLLIGSLEGAGASQRSAYGTQRQYDHAYVQCMYAKGERVPVSGNFADGRAQPRSAPADRYPPPPPPSGYPPPPPPGPVLR